MTDLALAPAERLLPSGPGGNAGPGLDAHLERHGALRIPTRKDPAWRDGILWAVAASGLAGRGGAGFPAAAKWDSVAGRSRRPVLVVNAMEGEPASAKDRVLLACSPHLVLDGAYVAATAVGASEIVVCVADHSEPAAASIEAAIAERRRAGKAVVRVSVQRPPGRYVTGEESALAGWLEGRRALPALRIGQVGSREHRSSTRVGAQRRDAGQVALIARHGPEWFRAMGTAEAPGSTLVTVTGAVRQPGVLEVELGTPLVDILARAGLDTELSAVLLGGYGGAWLDPSRLSTPYAPGPLAAAGATLGVGVVIALPASSCGVAETARIVRYMAGESAGQCGPCVFGLPAVADDLEGLWAGRAGRGVLGRIAARTAAVDGRGACRHPDGVARVVRTALAVFAADAAAHAGGRPCAGHAAPTVLTLPGSPAGRWAR